MDEINRLLRQTGLEGDTHLTIVSIFGTPIPGSTSDGTHYSPSAIANTIVKKDVFVSRNQVNKAERRSRSITNKHATFAWTIMLTFMLISWW